MLKNWKYYILKKKLKSWRVEKLSMFLSAIISLLVCSSLSFCRSCFINWSIIPFCMSFCLSFFRSIFLSLFLSFYLPFVLSLFLSFVHLFIQLFNLFNCSNSEEFQHVNSSTISTFQLPTFNFPTAQHFNLSFVNKLESMNVKLDVIERVGNSCKAENAKVKTLSSWGRYT